MDNKIIAYEWHNYETGHCYVDYVPHHGRDVSDGYTKKALVYENTAKEKQKEKIVESFDRENEYVTDEDIEDYFYSEEPQDNNIAYFKILGAKVMRNGGIKHIEK